MCDIVDINTTFCNIETNVVYFCFKNCVDRNVNQEMLLDVSTEHVLTISSVEMAKYCMLRWQMMGTLSFLRSWRKAAEVIVESSEWKDNH